MGANPYDQVNKDRSKTMTIIQYDRHLLDKAFYTSSLQHYLAKRLSFDLHNSIDVPRLESSSRLSVKTISLLIRLAEGNLKLSSVVSPEGDPIGLTLEDTEALEEWEYRHGGLFYVDHDDYWRNIHVCDDCGFIGTREELYDAGPRTLCHDCERNYAYCQDCGYYFAQDDLCGGLCDSCNEERELKTIKDWNYRPDFRFLKTDKDKSPLYFGFELEVESTDRYHDAKEVGEIPYIYCKNDGSLDEGFEIVSHPMTLSYLKDKDIFGNIKDRLSYSSSYHHDTTGFHVHMSKDAFSELHLLKFMEFHWQNPAFIVFIAQRPFGNFREQYSPDCPFDERLKAIAKCKGVDFNDDRYQAINITNTDTVEMRYFKGNLLPERNYKNIEFLHCLYRYTKQESLSKLSVERFLTFMKAEKKLYHNLIEYCDKRNPLKSWVSDTEKTAVA